MNTEEKQQIQQRIKMADALEERITNLKNLQGRLTAIGNKGIAIRDVSAGTELWQGLPQDLLAGVKQQAASLQTELGAV